MSTTKKEPKPFKMTPKQTERYYRRKAQCDQLRPIRIAIAREHGMVPEDWFVPCRTAPVCRVKELVAWIAKYKIGMTYKTVAVACGWASHDSSYAVCKKVNTNPDMRAEAERLYEKYKGAA